MLLEQYAWSKIPQPTIILILVRGHGTCENLLMSHNEPLSSLIAESRLNFLTVKRSRAAMLQIFHGLLEVGAFAAQLYLSGLKRCIYLALTMICG